MNYLTLPALNNTITIPDTLRDQFRNDGHVLVKGLLDRDECTAYRSAINDAAYKYNTEKRQIAERDTYGKAFLQVMNLWEVDGAVRSFTMARRFAKVAAQLLGVSAVRLYHDQALYKEAGGGFTPWHQDQYYWPLDTSATITMWMPLVDINVEMGMLTFASGSHKEGAVKNVAISDESERELNDHIKNKGYEISRPATMKAGDASWHFGWTLHSAPPNNSTSAREVMTVIYYADGARVTEPINKHQEADRQRWLGGLNAGELANSRLNPLL